MQGPEIELPPVPPRGGRRRDRHGRGPRGIAVLPGPLTPTGTPGMDSRQDRFDAIAVEAVAELEQRWSTELGLLEFGVEETPLLPPDWSEATMPLAAYVPAEPAEAGQAERPARLVLFRRPIELRAETPGELAALIQTVLVEQVAELLGRPPEEVDPRYEGD